jgi:hypothetical protein
MANWQRELDISNAFRQAQDGEIANEELAAEIAKKLLALPPFDIAMIDLEREDIADDFAHFEGDVDEFDHLMDRLYDWADTSLDGEWNGRKVCWVRTMA